MRIIYNKIIPFGNFIAINLFGVLFVRSKYKNRFTYIDTNHENIHTEQMKDFCKWMPLGGLLFYVHYVFEWIWRLIQSPKHAYYNISFEQEAYINEYNSNYIQERKRFEWCKYLKTKYKNNNE